jgi:hypothetical protein
LDEEGSLEARVMVRLASRQALIAHGEIDCPTAELGCRTDEAEAFDDALQIVGREARAREVIRDLRAEVDDLLLEHRHELGAICVALLQRWTLSGDEVREIAGDCRDRRWHLPQRAGLFPAIQAGPTIAAAGVLPPFGAGWRVQAPEPLAVDGERPGPSIAGVPA